MENDESGQNKPPTKPSASRSRPQQEGGDQQNHSGTGKRTSTRRDKKSIRELWRNASSLKKAELILLCITASGALAGIVYLFFYIVFSGRQSVATQSDQRPIIAADISPVYSVGPGPDPRTLIQIPASKDKPIAVNMTVKNIGKSPALNVLGHLHIVFGSNTHLLKVEPPDKINEFSRTITIIPEHPIHIHTVSAVDTYALETMDIPSMDSLVMWDGTFPIVVFGRIYYEDRYGNSYCLPYIYDRSSLSSPWEDASNWKDYGAAPIVMRSVNALCPIGQR